ncbi:MAG: Eco57I restriction-modification methylase domain-containing protein [Candidatus Babeliales bacterium]
MKFDPKTVRKTINKAFLKEPVERTSFNKFKDSLQQLLEHTISAQQKNEHEEHFKNFLVPFFNEVGFNDYYINTSVRIDLAIHNGKKGKDPVGVLIEVKRPSNVAEMITKEQLNRKAMHEAVLYYLEQRIEQDNSDLKHVIVTNMNDWFIFDAQEFERCFYQSSVLRRTWKEWKSDRKVSSNNDFMYGEISKFMDKQETAITGLWLPLSKTQKFLKGEEESEYEKKLIPLYKLFTPTHLLKEPFANDSNSLNREFYRELLYILGLEETKEGNARFIKRAEEGNRNPGSIIENTIRILDAEDHLSTLKNALSAYGSNRNEQLFSVAMELSITWMNRILFLKLLEAQLFRYHRQDTNFKFLNYKAIDSLDELNKLFFQVLARKEKDRSPDVNEKFGHIPYLNSSLFDVSSLERQTTRISGLDDHAVTPVDPKSVLNKERGNSLNTLDYLFRFLEAYDFSAEGSEEIRDERKSLINASVLGLIFEKINGYKDGSFYTPGFITEYMAKTTLNKAVTDAYNEKYGWECSSFDELYNHIHREKLPFKEANGVINELKICDPAVGSGHFLVSCLNELIAIKSKMDILCDSSGKVLRQIDVSVENDELIISWGDEGLFEYDVSHTWKGTKLSSRNISPELERVQQALFHEKRYLIENCLFGVDINPNSVKICRLRLWIELLKRAYYTHESNYMELEVLPNIDINIKQGNSLVSRFDLDADLSSVFKNSSHSLENYKQAVQSYKHTGDRTEKARLQRLIDDIKSEYSTTLYNNSPINKKLSKERGKLEIMQSDDLFGDVKFTKKQVAAQKKKVKKLTAQKTEQESGVFYNQAFEWRFEFPEVLDDEGQFTGFNVVIGNPPYVRQEQFKELKPYLKDHYTVYQGTADLYSYFIELGIDLLNEGGYFQYIVANKWMRANYGKPLRQWLQEKVNINAIYDFGDLPVFEEATTYPCLLQLSKTKPTELFQAAEIKTLEFDILKDHINKHHFDSNQTKLLTDGWNLLNKEALQLLDKIKKKSILLGELVDGKIYRGVITGLDDAFIVDENKKEQLINDDYSSEELLKPYLRGKDVGKFQDLSSAYYIIFIPNGWTRKESKGAKNKWEWFKESYPAIAKHLNYYSEKGKKRYDQGEFWWELRPCDYYDEFLKTKITYLKFQVRPAFTLDRTGFISNSAVWFISETDKQLLAILNSKLGWYLISIFCTKIRNGYQLIYKYLKNIPIVIDETSKPNFEAIVDEILTTKKISPQADIRNLESELDQLVYKLYGLNEEEINFVENYFTDLYK